MDIVFKKIFRNNFAILKLIDDIRRWGLGREKWMVSNAPKFHQNNEWEELARLHLHRIPPFSPHFPSIQLAEKGIVRLHLHRISPFPPYEKDFVVLSSKNFPLRIEGIWNGHGIERDLKGAVRGK
jgi:hypothetical protein